MNRPPVIFYVSKFLAGGLLKTILNINVDGMNNIPEDKQFILICNHLNWSDPFILYTIFPARQNMVFLAEHEGIYDSKFKKKFIDIHGKPIVVIHRDKYSSRVAALKAMFKVVRGGKTLAVFPEGRLGHREGDLFPFHVGVFSLAKKLFVPILPVAIAGSKKLSLRKPINVKIGDLTYSREEESGEDFARRMAEKLRDLLPPYPGDGPFPDCCTWMTELFQGELRPFNGNKDLIISTSKEKRNNKNLDG